MSPRDCCANDGKSNSDSDSESNSNTNITDPRDQECSLVNGDSY